ncbi:MAG TPA: hypothetical protein DCO79_15150 [Spirochaeta sp.]|nr:hypothetical protein [Spirochaeta sp.]
MISEVIIMIMSERKILAVDIGTQSLKASIIDENRKTLDRAKVAYAPVTRPGNCVEIDVSVLWNAFLKACTEINCSEISGIVFSTLCPSLLLMDGGGNALTPVILHLDRRSQKQADWIVKNIGIERFRSITGNPPIPGGISVTSMLWIKEQYGGKLPDGAVFGHVITWFMKKLAGKFLIEPSNASFTGLYETLNYSDWSNELLEKTGISRAHLPDIIDSAEIAGLVDKSVSAETGLPAGAKVIIGANDTACAAVGAGVNEPGMLLNTAGTVEILLMCSDKPIAGENHLIRTHAYRDRWLLMRTLGAGGASIEWFRTNFCRELSRDEFYLEYLAAVLSGMEKSPVQFRPYLSGDRQKLDNLTASFSNIALDSNREDMLFALISGNVNYLMGILDEWKNICDISDRILHVGGGAAGAYTEFKQKLMKEFKFEIIGETAETGAAVIGFKAMNSS